MKIIQTKIKLSILVCSNLEDRKPKRIKTAATKKTVFCDDHFDLKHKAYMFDSIFTNSYLKLNNAMPLKLVSLHLEGNLSWRSTSFNGNGFPLSSVKVT